MHKRIIYLLVLTILGFTSCTNEKHQDLKSLTTTYTYLEGKVLPCDSWLESVGFVAFFDEKIIIRSYAEDILTLYSVTNDSIVKVASFAKKGIGPNEFFGSVECYFDQLSNVLYVFGIVGGNRVLAYQINVSSIGNLFNKNSWIPINISTAEKCSWKSFIPLSDSIFLALGGEYDKTNLLSTIHTANSIVKGLNVQLQDDINVNPAIRRLVYNNGGLLKKPSSDKYLYYCSNWGNYAEIVTLSNGQLSDRKIIANTYPIYKAAADGINSVSDMKTLMGITSYVTDNYIYLLPNFRSKQEYLNKTNNNGYPSDHSDALYVFDWNGKFIKTYKLSTPIENFVISSDDSYILGGTEAAEDIQIIKFQLK